MFDCWRWLFDHNIIYYIVHTSVIGSYQFTECHAGPECNIPVGCTSHSVNAIFCDDNGNIEDDCNDATTTTSTVTSTATSTTPTTTAPTSTTPTTTLPP